ncbi:DUF2164 domain-containing protein [Clostridium sp. DL1XJH146]
MKKQTITLSIEKRRTMIESIQTYFYKEREEDLGDLAAGLILDFVMEELAPEIYNQGVYDSYTYMTERVDDILSIQKI